MFKCRECSSIDYFELMFSPDYKGDKNLLIENTENGIKITVDGYTFMPDLNFINAHAVCGYCGNINCFEYDENDESENVINC